jgi:hypothetical protein
VSTAKDELRAEIAALREELAAERARVEVLREQAVSHRCACGHGGWYWCGTCNVLAYPGFHVCGGTYTITNTWPPPNTCVTTNYAQTSVAAGCAGAQTTWQLVNPGN